MATKLYNYRITLFLFISILVSTFSVNFSYADNAGEPLDPEQAFQVTNTYNEHNDLVINFNITKGYQIYADSIQLTNDQSEHIDLKTVLPKNKTTFLNNFQFIVLNNKLSGDIKNLEYQGCQIDGVCYPPQKYNLSNAHKKKTLEITTVNAAVAKTQIYTWANLLSFLGIGLLLAFTPCVLPMLPIVMNIVIGQERQSIVRNFSLVSTYVLSMASVYAVAGLFSAQAGQTIQSALQQPLFIFSLSGLLIFMALCQLDLFVLPGSNKINQLLYKVQGKQKSGSFVSSAMLGALAALLLSPCVTPALVGILTYVGQTGDQLYGLCALFTLGIGMGLPLLALAVIGPSILPQSGPWLNYTKRLTALLLVGLSVWLASPFISSYISSTTTSKSENNVFNIITELPELNRALKQAALEEKIVLIDYSAQWCKTCKVMEKTVFTDSEVINKLKDFIVLKVDLTDKNSTDLALTENYQIFAPPTIIFLDSTGKEQLLARMVGQVGKDEFLKKLNKVSKLVNIQTRQSPNS